MVNKKLSYYEKKFGKKNIFKLKKDSKKKNQFLITVAKKEIGNIQKDIDKGNFTIEDIFTDGGL